MAAKKKAADSVISLTRLGDSELSIPIVGLTPVIPHAWSEKARRMMPGHPDADTVKEKKGKRNPQEEAEGCLYRLPDGRPGVRAISFKAAMVGSCRFFDRPSMVEAKSLIHVIGEGVGAEQLIPIDGDLVLKEDEVRNANGSADLRYRYYICNWSATIRVRFVQTCISSGSVVSLLDAAGRLGVGDWRPNSPKSASGIFGTWRVRDDAEVKAA